MYLDPVSMLLEGYITSALLLLPSDNLAQHCSAQQFARGWSLLKSPSHLFSYILIPFAAPWSIFLLRSDEEKACPYHLEWGDEPTQCLNNPIANFFITNVISVRDVCIESFVTISNDWILFTKCAARTHILQVYKNIQVMCISYFGEE